VVRLAGASRHRPARLLVITPVRKRTLLGTLKGLRPIREAFPRIADRPAERVDL
jgi:hypothetical protein